LHDAAVLSTGDVAGELLSLNLGTNMRTSGCLASLAFVLAGSAQPRVAHGQALTVIDAIGSKLLPAISTEIGKFWKPKQKAEVVAKKQEEFKKSLEATKKDVLKDFASEVQNLAKIRQAFELARVMQREVGPMAALSNQTFLSAIKLADVTAKSAVAQEYVFHWQALQPLNARAQALVTDNIDANLRADLQRNVDRIQQGMTRIAASLAIPADLQAQTNILKSLSALATAPNVAALPESEKGGGKTDIPGSGAEVADRFLNAMSRSSQDVADIQSAITDLSLLISVRLGAYEESIRKATQ
jgi:hypothetical protein